MTLTFRPFDPENGVRVTCDVGYLCADFGLSVLDLGSMHATDVRQKHRLTLYCTVYPFGNSIFVD